MSGPAVTGEDSYMQKLSPFLRQNANVEEPKIFPKQGEHICRARPGLQEEKLHPFLQVGLRCLPHEADQAGQKDENEYVNFLFNILIF